MKRREFLKVAALGSVGIGMSSLLPVEAKATLTPEQEAFEVTIKKLQSPGGYYEWVVVDKDKRQLVRIPKITPANEIWMKDEHIELIHVCDPIKFVASMKAQCEEGLANFSGYARDNICRRCGTGILT